LRRWLCRKETRLREGSVESRAHGLKARVENSHAREP
jgi:hypothetical protein